MTSLSHIELYKSVDQSSLSTFAFEPSVGKKGLSAELVAIQKDGKMIAKNIR